MWLVLIYDSMQVYGTLPANFEWSSAIFSLLADSFSVDKIKRKYSIEMTRNIPEREREGRETQIAVDRLFLIGNLQNKFL